MSTVCNTAESGDVFNGVFEAIVDVYNYSKTQMALIYSMFMEKLKKIYEV